MVNTGIIRRIDELGRIVIPCNVREKAGIKEGDPFEISFGNGEVYLKLHKTLELEFSDISKKWQDMTIGERKDFIETLNDHLDD